MAAEAADGDGAGHLSMLWLTMHVIAMATVLSNETVALIMSAIMHVRHWERHVVMKPVTKCRI